MPSASAKSSQGDIRYDWFQSSKNCEVSIFIKNAPKDKVVVNFDSLQVTIEFSNPEGAPFVLKLGPLAQAIDISKCSFRVFTTKIELYLVKISPGQWPSLLASELDSNANKLQSKNWERLAEQELGSSAEADSDPNTFFKQIFSSMDANGQRAMMKSYIESNGTALSTNWEDVKGRTVETMPPDGAEVKKW